jgi:hypothetical protein
MEYKMNYLRQFKLLASSLYGYIIGIIFLGLFVTWINDGNIHETTVVLLIALAPILIPLSILHLNYFFQNHNQTVTIDKNNNYIIIRKSGCEEKHLLNDIENIRVVKSLYYKNENKSQNLWSIVNAPMWIPWSDYGYIKISLKNKDNFVLTNLLIDLDQIPFQNFIKEYKMFPIITK